MAADTAPAPQLTCDDLLRLEPSLQAHLESFLPLFPRRDQGTSFLAYCEGLLSEEQRKSVERMVLRELDGDMNQVRRLQYFAADSPWCDQPFPDGTGRRWERSWARAKASCWWTPPTCPSRGCTRWGWPGSTAGGWARLRTARRGCSWPTPGRAGPRWSTGGCS